ncbi:MAG: S8 family serine peptidase [Bacteroidota bacterium]|nr:S8 family serine peptidase [Bacteroidota bacterium]
MRLIGIILLIACFTFISENTSAQSIGPQKQTKKVTVINKRPGHIYQTVAVKDSVRVIDVDMTEMTDVIVEYKDEPMFIQQKTKGLKKASIASFQTRQLQFSSDLARIYDNTNRAFNTTFGRPLKKKEYCKVFNGASLTVPKAMISQISLLPYVKRVYKDGIVKADLKESVRIIGADSVWNKYNDQGDSVIVGVIDTGIDYMHPALGGGFGKGHKVIGGYDFVNKDNDPMDDHSHGTHVAGIIAANSDNMKGVAPKALLVAYKVLNSRGSGYDSDIISAIEMAVDPNGDNNYDDKLDIVNMSLGNDRGNPFDALTEAVNNAVKLGVTFCIAAANSGDYATIGSPATAELAITVGASNKMDKLANFSSKGPVKKTYIMKPEILAPGVDINSTLPHNSYGVYSGTSMASPMAAGVCALLKHRHKDWTPEMIKSALISSARDLGFDIMSQGAGRINALKAMSIKTFAIPSQLNYGLDNAEETSWVIKDTVTILNGSGILQNYTVNIIGLSNGILLTPSLNNFSLNAGETKRVVFTLTVNNSSVPFSSGNGFSYSGKVSITNTSDSLIIPWSFVKTPVLAISFKQPFLTYAIYKSGKLYNDFTAWNQDDSLYSEIMLPQGKYTVLSSFYNLKDSVYNFRFMAKPDITLNGYKSINIDPEEANLSFIFNGTDETGKKIEDYSSSYKHIQLSLPVDEQLKSPMAFPEEMSMGFMLDNKHILKSSTLPSDIKIYAGQFQIDTKKENTVRVLQFPAVKGMSSNLEFKNSPGSLFNQKIGIDLSCDTSQAADITFSCMGKQFRIDYQLPGETITDKIWKGQIYLMPDVDSTYGFTTAIHCYKKGSYDDNWETGPFRTSSDGNILIFNGMYSTKSGSETNFGDGPIIYPWSKWSIYSDDVNKYFDVYGRGKLNEQRFFDDYHSTYTVYDKQNKIVLQGTLHDNKPFNIGSGPFREEIVSDYYTVAGRHGHEKIKFDLTLAANSLPPAITQFHINNSSGAPVTILKKGEKAQIVFSVKSINGVPIDTVNTKIFVKRSGAQTWNEISVSERNNDNTYGIVNTCELGKYTDSDSSGFDIKITIQDNDKRTTEFTMEPAFVVEGYPYTAMDQNEPGSVALPKEYNLFNNYPNPFNPTTTIRYSLPKQSYVELKLFDMLGREVTTLVNKEQNAGEYKIQFNASSLPSGIYIYSIQAGDYRASKKMMILK